MLWVSLLEWLSMIASSDSLLVCVLFVYMCVSYTQILKVSRTYVLTGSVCLRCLVYIRGTAVANYLVATMTSSLETLVFLNVFTIKNKTNQTSHNC